ncbi:hypothetical protein ACJMK2_044586 [Sinanodonta woodiana]|uniref:Uncharacterized protein n=1 Tax=Sinanodonta woodiana TaxID=1069815 RepID=A0ABD3W2D6_SINWO
MGDPMPDNNITQPQPSTTQASQRNKTSYAIAVSTSADNAVRNLFKENGEGWRTRRRKKNKNQTLKEITTSLDTTQHINEEPQSMEEQEQEQTLWNKLKVSSSSEEEMIPPTLPVNRNEKRPPKKKNKNIQ